MEKTTKMLAFLHPIIEEADPELEDFLVRYMSATLNRNRSRTLLIISLSSFSLPVYSHIFVGVRFFHTTLTDCVHVLYVCNYDLSYS